MGGMIDWLMLQSKMLVKKMMPFSPKCFNIIDAEMLSGPLEFLAFLIALRVCSGVMTMAGSEVISAFYVRVS